MKLRKSISAVIVALFTLLILASCNSGSDKSDVSHNDKDNQRAEQSEKSNASHIDWDNHDQRAEQFVMALVNGDYDTAAAGFVPELMQGLGVSGLKEAWENTVRTAGAFISVTGTEVILDDNIPHEEYDIYHVVTRHENSGINSRIVFSKDGLVAGLLFTFVENTDDLDITQKDGYTDFPVVIGEGTDFPLNGLLSIPDNAAGQVPAVVIVHGSGAHDMDLTLFANKPYQDVAEYLASNGIAVIRYNKRTFAHGAKMGNSYTIREETIEDAILATEILKADPRIDENKVFVIGHSLGGMLAPRIHAEGGDYAGLILLAGSPRFLLDISKDQTIAGVIAAMDGEDRETALAQIEEHWDLQTYELVNLPDDTAKNTPTEGVTAYYYKELYEHPATAYIENITVPFLVVQGSNDLQILTDVDFAAYQELLAGRSNVTFKLYEGLNHLFMPSTIKNITEILDEYAIEGRFDSQVLADITAWILEQSYQKT